MAALVTVSRKEGIGDLPANLLWMVRDVSEMRAAEAALRESEERLRPACFLDKEKLKDPAERPLKSEGRCQNLKETPKNSWSPWLNLNAGPQNPKGSSRNLNARPQNCFCPCQNLKARPQNSKWTSRN